MTYSSWREENQIHSLPVTNPVKEKPFHEPEDWEAFQAEAIRCSEELCQGRVSNLTFEKSRMEDGCDLYGYSFEYDTGGRNGDPRTPDGIKQYALGELNKLLIKQGKLNDQLGIIQEDINRKI